jgi:hypothetical protein
MSPRPQHDDEDAGHGDGEYCDLCKQEYTDHCPIRSSKCPFEGGGDDADEEEEADDGDDS